MGFLVVKASDFSFDGEAFRRGGYIQHHAIPGK
jgi:hypothetical protein